MRTLLSVCLGAVIAFAQAPQNPADPQAAEKKKIRLEGQVLSKTGDPLRRATVRLQPAPQPGQTVMGQMPQGYSETSDDSGRFVFEDVAPGRYTLVADRTGYVAQRYGARSDTSPGTPLTVVEGQEIKDLVFRLTPQGVIAGRVTDMDGEPVPNVQIKVLRYTYMGGKRQLTPAGGPGAGGVVRMGPGSLPATDDQGAFRVPNLSPGRYYVSADPFSGGFMMQERSGRAAAAQAADVVTYYPNSLDVQGAVPIDLTAGGELRGIDIKMRRERVYSIRGKVVDAGTGAPITTAMIFVQPPESGGIAMSGFPATTRPGPDGSFELRNLLPGTHVLRGSSGSSLQIASGSGVMMMRTAAGGDDASPRVGRLEVTITDSDARDVLLPLAAGADVPGSVRLDGQDLKEWLKPSTQSQQGPGGGMPPILGMPGGVPSVRLSTSEGLSVNVPSAQFREDGSFLLRGVAPGKYYVNVGGLPQGGYVKSIRVGGRDATRAPVDLTSGAGESIEIVVSTKAAEVSGTVRNNDGALGGVTVSLWPKNPDMSSPTGGIRTATTDQNGSFKISAIVPGDYYLAAWEELPDNGLAQNAEFLAQFTSAGTSVKLSEGGRDAAEARLIARDRVFEAVAKLP
jgi:protocatechuate 3,4-dioxygenase beta subunit